MTEINTIKSYSFFREIRQAGGEIYLVGGCVRDLILKRPIKDLDVVVRLIPMNDLIKVLKKCGKTNLVGKSFGIIKFHPNENRDLEIDIALPRQEISTGVGHKDFDVKFDENLNIEKDLMRRDFTINAMAQNLASDELLDPAEGRSHLEKKEIHTVFEDSFVDDPLRLLRAVQFASRFGFQIAKKTFEEMEKHAALIKTVAPERVILEIRKLFDAPKPSTGFDLMRDCGLLPHVFPDVQKNDRCYPT